MMDLTGKTLANLIVNALLAQGIPTPPTNPTPDQEAAYQAVLAAQTTTWTTICENILTYVNQNATLDIPGTGILDGYGNNCSGQSITGTIS
jgi:hypothetical protein